MSQGVPLFYDRIHFTREGSMFYADKLAHHIDLLLSPPERPQSPVL